MNIEKYIKLLISNAIIIVIVSCESNSQIKLNPGENINIMESSNLELATFGSGCFWCTEAVFLKVKGVNKVVSGYSGGNVPNPSYEAVCTGKTGHAEVIQIQFDPELISFEELLQIFWKTHDPTTLNRQGADVGTQYRSVIFYHNEDQKQIANQIKAELEHANIWDNAIVTEITEFRKFYAAEDYHQNYYERNSNQPYCSFVITPKIEKFEKIFKDKLKK